MNIDNLIREAVGKISFDEMFQKVLKEQIEKTVQSVLKDSLGSYSTLSKELEKVVEEKLKIDLSCLTLPEYSAFVLDQLEIVLKDQMSDERSALMRKAIAEKLTPHLAKEVEFEKLIGTIEVALRATFDEGDPCCDTKYMITCEAENKSYSSQPYYQLTIFYGDESSKDELAVLCLNDDKVYHSRGKRGDSLTKRFASYAHIRTTIRGVYEFKKTISPGDRD